MTALELRAYILKEHVRNMKSVLKEEFGIEVTIEDEKGIENG